jgi:NADPH:quinone reductase-like Zn-dependent oxidoreductase
VRLAVKTVGVAFADVYLRRGITPGAPCPPVVPGFDVVGIVDAVGREAKGVQVGARVAAIVERGGSARYLCVDASRVVPVPASVSDEAAVAVLLNYVTALQMLLRIGHAQRGQSVFVHAVAGGVGTAVLDLGRLLGLRVFGTASIGKHALVRALGGTPIDYRAGDFVAEALALVPEQFPIVMDGIGGQNLVRSHALVADGGTLVSLGFQSVASQASRFAAWPTLATVGWLALRRRRRSRFYAIVRFNRRHPDWLRSDLEFVLDRLAQGELSPVIADVLPLATIARAHAALERGDTHGKLILRVDS